MNADARPGPSELNVAWRVGLFVVPPLARSLFRLRFLDVQRVPLDGPAILACNHVSVLDGPLLAIAPSEQRRRIVRFLVAAEVFDSGLFGPILGAFEQISIRRGTGDAAALEEAIRTIHDGALAGIFPEGTVNPGPPSRLQRVRTGAARIALAADAPIVPVGIWGTQVRWPRKGLRLTRPMRTPVTIAFGEGIPPSGDPNSMEDVATLTDRLAGAMAGQVARAASATG
jgi:1-acyl-sn-glycerol-3-phosphate acyltransferase